MVYKSTLQGLDLENINAFFQSIVNDHTNGNLKDVCSKIKLLSKAQKLAFHYFIPETDTKTATGLKNILLETVLNPHFN